MYIIKYREGVEEGVYSKLNKIQRERAGCRKGRL